MKVLYFLGICLCSQLFICSDHKKWGKPRNKDVQRTGFRRVTGQGVESRDEYVAGDVPVTKERCCLLFGCCTSRKK